MRRRIHALVAALAREHTAPSRLAAGVLVGVVVGCSPLFGFHLPLCIAFAWLLGLNQLVVYGAANVSIPPFVPFIGLASVQLGNRVLHGHWLALHLDDFAWKHAPQLAKTFFLDWLLGGVLVGGALGLVGATLVYVTARSKRNAPPDPLLDIITAASKRYSNLPRQYRFYAYFKYRLDPCYRAIAPHVRPGSFTVDLGTGLGMLPMVLALSGERRVLGVEWDPGKLAAGQRASSGIDAITLVGGDVRTVDIPPCDVITIVDLLHYYDAETQRALLQRCRAALRPGGRLLVREGDRARRGGARFTRLVETLATRLGWNRGPSVRFRPVRELVADLEALGLRVHVDEVAGKLHPGNVLLVAELPA